MSQRLVYRYAIVRYCHDPSVGEALNVGVILYCPESRYLGYRFSADAQRVSSAYGGFNTVQYHRMVQGLEASLRVWVGRLEMPALPLEGFLPPQTLQEVLSAFWSDNGLSYQIGEELVGLTSNPEDEVDALYERFISSLYTRGKRRQRDDEDVWRFYLKSLQRNRVQIAFEPKEVEVGGFSFRFPHTFQNGTRHVLEATTTDYKQQQGIRDRIRQILGEVDMLSETEEIGRVYFLLGHPTNGDHLPAYRNAVTFLRRKLADSRFEVVEEEESDQFALKLARIAGSVK